MWKKIKDILCKHTAYKDGPSMISIDDDTMMASVIDLGPSLTKSLQQTDILYHEPLSKLATNTLNKTNEHCRSLLNLLPTSFRSRHYRQALSKKCTDASTLTTPTLPSIDIIETDYDSGYMSQSLLNRTPSYTSCHSAMPISSSISVNRCGSIENLLNGYSKSHPAKLQIIVRKNFEPFAQAHIAVLKGTIVTALFSRGPWLYVRVNATGKTGYIPRMICSTIKTNHLSISSTDEQFHLGKMQLNSTKQPINRYLSHSSAIINDSKQHLHLIPFNERDRRHTYTLPHKTRSKEYRSTQSTVNLIPTRDTDSSSTQDSGYSDSTSFFLIQTSDQEQNQLEKEQNRPQISLVHKYDNGDKHTSKYHSIGSIEHRQTLTRRLPEFAMIRNVRRDQSKSKPTINNLPKSHVQIPASIFLNHHRQKQQFGSSHSAFRPVQSKRASSEGHSPSSSSSLSSSNSSLNLERRRLSFDLTRSVCDPTSSPKRITNVSRTMSEILCDQFSEINLDAIEKDSLVQQQQQQPRKSRQTQTCLYTIVKDYRSSRASFTVKRGEFVHVLKQIGRSCYLVRKQVNGQIGFLPKTLVIPSTSTRIETFLETHGYRETII